MKSKRKIFVMTAFLLVLMLAACTPSSQATQDGSGSGGDATTVRVGWPGSPDSLNPGVGILVESYALYELIYESIYQEEPDGTFTLDVAESVETSDDGLVWTFKIRPNLVWHDGEPLTAKDVAFSLNLHKTHEDFTYLNGYTEHFASIEATDDSTVVITLDAAIPNMESQLIYLYILPEHIWSKLEGTAATEFENNEMIGSGPFKMEEYKQNEFVHLKAFDKNHRYQPKVTDVIFQTFENQDALVQALKTGQVDMINEMPATAITTLKESENVAIVSGPPLAPYVTDIIFNQVKPENCPPDDGICSGHPALLDRNVRLAMAHATDKQQIIQVVKLGYAAPGLTLIPDGLKMWYNSDLKDYEYDVAKANQILDDAGYKDADGDGVREMPDGTNPLNFRMNWPSDSTTASRMAELLNDMWKQIGIGTQLQAVDPDALTAACCPAFDFDIILWGWGSDPDPSGLLVVMTTGEITTGSSETGYSNPEYDALYDEQSVELDREKRIEMVKQMQKIVFDDVVYIIPYYEQAVQAYRTDRFTGWLTTGRIALEDVSSLAVIEPVK